MIKRLVLLFCCILLLPTIAAADGNFNYGDFWVGGQVGAVWTPETRTEVTGPNFNRTFNLGTEPGVTAGAIVGYNFCMPYRPAWQRYFGVALDFQWNQFHQDKLIRSEAENNGNQFALALLGRLQYPLMGSERFTRGRIVPFLMFGPAVVWTNANFSNTGSSKTSTDFGLVAEVGVEFFILPHLSIGPSFRYRHVFGPDFDVQGGKIDEHGVNQFALLGRLAWHF